MKDRCYVVVVRGYQQKDAYLSYYALRTNFVDKHDVRVKTDVDFSPFVEAALSFAQIAFARILAQSLLALVWDIQKVFVVELNTKHETLIGKGKRIATSSRR